MMRGISAYLNFLLAAVLLTVFFPGISTAQEPLLFGLTLGLTGKYEKQASMQKKGYDLWAQKVNAQGGLLGRQVRLLILDDESDRGKAGTLYKKLITEHRVNFLFAPFSSDLTEEILPLTRDEGFPVIAAGAAADRLWQKGYTHLFGVFTPAGKIAVSFLEMAVMHELETVVIVSASDPFSLDVARGAEKWGRRFGMRIIRHASFPQSSADLAVLASEIRALAPDILLTCGHLDEAVQMRLALAQAGWQPRVFYTPVGPGLPAFYERLGELSNGVFSTTQWEYDGGRLSPGTMEFIASFKGMYKMEPSYFAATAFAAGQIMEAAINRVGRVDRRELQDVLTRLDMETIIGRFGVDRTGLPIKNYSLVLQVQERRRKIIWPANPDTSDPRFE